VFKLFIYIPIVILLVLCGFIFVVSRFMHHSEQPYDVASHAADIFTCDH